MTSAIFGYMQGEFYAAGNAVQEGIEIDFSECFIIPDTTEEKVTIYGVLSDDPVNSTTNYKLKGDGWNDYKPTFLRVEVLTKEITKEYNGEKKKKEPTIVGAYIASQLLSLEIGEGKYYRLKVNFGAPEMYVNALSTGKSSKGKDIEPELLSEFKNEIFTIEPLEKADQLADKKPQTGSGGSRQRITQADILNQRLFWLVDQISSEEKVKALEEAAVWLESHPSKSAMAQLLIALMGS